MQSITSLRVGLWRIEKYAWRGRKMYRCYFSCTISVVVIKRRFLPTLVCRLSAESKGTFVALVVISDGARDSRLYFTVAFIFFVSQDCRQRKGQNSFSRVPSPFFASRRRSRRTQSECRSTCVRLRRLEST